jgi:hypothetical protein
MNANILMNIGTWLLCVASVPNFISIWKNRHDLKGYSTLGCLTFFFGLLFIAISFFQLGMISSFAAQILPLIMWGMASYFSWRSNQ